MGFLNDRLRSAHLGDSWPFLQVLLCFPIPAMTPEQKAEKIANLENFVHDKLDPDLQRVMAKREVIYEEMSEYLALQETCRRMQESSERSMKTQVDIGSNIYVQAKVPDTSRIIVEVALGFHLEFTLEEAIDFISEKEEHLEAKAEELTRQAAGIKAHVKVTLGAISELMQ